jgi:hypothetical protein
MTRIGKIFIIVIIVVGIFGLVLLVQNILVKGPVAFDIFCGLSLGALIPAVRYIVKVDGPNR